MIKLISTDFDGTAYAELEQPPVAVELQELIGEFQRQGAKWVINTGRDMPGLMECLERMELNVKPDYLVLVEREIHRRDGASYVELDGWNDRCRVEHETLFVQVRRDLTRLSSWVQSRYDAVIYEDAYSPFCYMASCAEDAADIHRYLDEYCLEVPKLMVMRNHVYARFCHSEYHKGSALAEVARHMGIEAGEVFAAGDHLNDLPMLTRRYAGYLAAPGNALDEVKEAVRGGKGYVSELPQGRGVAEALKHYLGAREGAKAGSGSYK